MINMKNKAISIFAGGGAFLKQSISAFSPIVCIFLFSIVFYLIAGMLLIYQNGSVFSHYDTLFYADAISRLNDFFAPTLKIKRICAHPLFALLIRPISFILKGLFIDSIVTILSLQAIIAACSNCIIYSMLSRLCSDKKIPVIFTLLYALSFSTIIYTIVPETYIFSAFFLLLFWYYIIYIIEKHTESLSLQQIFMTACLAVFAYGIELANLITVIVGIIYLVRQVYRSNYKRQFLNFGKILLMFLLVISILTLLQKLVYPNIFLITKWFSTFFNNEYVPDYKFCDFSLSLTKLYNVCVQIFMVPFAAFPYWYKQAPLEKICLFVNTSSGFHFICGLVLYLVTVVLSFLNFKNLKYKSLLGTFLIIVLISFVLNCFYAPKEGLLYSQNYLFSLVLLSGIAASCIEVGKKFIVSFYSVFLGYQILNNIYSLYKIEKLFSPVMSDKYSDFVLVLIGIFAALVIGTFVLVSRRVISKDILSLPVEKKYLFSIVLYLCYIIVFAMFAAINYWRL